MGYQDLFGQIMARSSGKFANFLEEVGVKQETSSAYNPASNGFAERAVQAFKKALKKTGGKGTARG